MYESCCPTRWRTWDTLALNLCCIYLQAVPCDPAGADFNFAALSFNCKLLHQIHLVPLHDRSLAEIRRTFTSSERKTMPGGWKALRREWGIRAILITTFPPVRLVMCWDLRLRLFTTLQPTHSPHPMLSLIQTYSFTEISYEESKNP